MSIEDNIYTECNSHLKETDRKRNQLISVYIILIGLLISNYDNLSANKDIILGIFCGIGLLVNVASIHYRKWHIIYARASQAVALHLLMHDMAPEQRIREIDSRLELSGYMCNPWSWLNPFKSTEAAIFLVLVLATYIPIQLFLVEKNILLIKNSFFLSFLAGAALHYVLFTLAAFYLIRSTTKKSPFDEWILIPIKLATESKVTADAEDKA